MEKIKRFILYILIFLKIINLLNVFTIENNSGLLYECFVLIFLFHAGFAVT